MSCSSSFPFNPHLIFSSIPIKMALNEISLIVMIILIASVTILEYGPYFRPLRVYLRQSPYKVANKCCGRTGAKKCRAKANWPHMSAAWVTIFCSEL